MIILNFQKEVVENSGNIMIIVMKNWHGERIRKQYKNDSNSGFSVNLFVGGKVKQRRGFGFSLTDTLVSQHLLCSCH